MALTRLLQRKKSAYFESDPFRMLRSQAHRIGGGSKLWMPALEIACSDFGCVRRWRSSDWK
jgi:hypothetical protein